MIVALLLLLLAVFGAPLFAIIATSAMVGFHSNDTEQMTMALELISISQTPILTAIPLFTFAGYLLSESRAPQRLVRLTSAMFGWMPGGLALVCLAACAFFTAFTGASGVTIIALGAILYPALKQDGYGDRFNLGLVTSSGSLGLLFAPSLPLILYGVVTKVSIDDLFRAGILPGLLMLIMLGGYSIWTNRGNRKPIGTFSVRRGWLRAARSDLGAAVAFRRTGWNLFRHPGRIRGCSNHRPLRVHCRSADLSRDNAWPNCRVSFASRWYWLAPFC